MNKEVVAHTYSGILLSLWKEQIWVCSSGMDESKAYYTKWSKSEREKQLLFINAYLWNLEKWYWWAYLKDRNRDAGIENRFVDMVKGERMVGWTEGVALTNVYYFV